MKKAHTSPSRRRYEERKPVWSVRMPKEWIDRIELFLKKTNQSREDFMSCALNIQSLDYQKIYNQGYNEGKIEGKKQGYNEGFNEGENKGFVSGATKGHNLGYDMGKKDWAITINCYKCNNPVEILPRSEHHEIIKTVMKSDICHHHCRPADEH